MKSLSITLLLASSLAAQPSPAPTGNMKTSPGAAPSPSSIQKTSGKPRGAAPDGALAKPPGLPAFNRADFVINRDRLGYYPEGFVGGSRATLESIFDFLLKDQFGQTAWSARADLAAKVLNRWDFDRRGFERYVYQVPQLQELSLIYLATGHKELGEFIRGHILQIADLPFEFWLHAELRGYNPKRPVGGLETAAVSTTVALVLSASPDLFSPAEKAKIDTALREKGLGPCLTWLSQGRANNWLAVVSSGAYIAAKYLRDPEGMDKASKGMARYVADSIEADGSYGEGKSYFSYPIGALLPALLAMNPEERTALFSTSGLRHSATWMVYSSLFSSDKKNRHLALHSGDNGYHWRLSSKVGAILAHLFNDPVAAWLRERFPHVPDLMELLFVHSNPTSRPRPASPAELGLPLMKTFANGDAFMRSSWDQDGIVLQMLSGDGSLVNYSHQRPELGSITLGAYGEYLVVSPGSASYRSPLRYQWDMTTRSANTITIDRQNQLFPKRSVNSAWNTTDVSAFWQDGDPKAEIVTRYSDGLADVLVNELSGAYHVPMKHVRRSVIFVKSAGYHVVVDRIQARDSAHHYSWWLHLNNRDGKGSLREVREGSHWYFSRPRADLAIHLFSDQPVTTKIGQGHMHGPSRDYSPGGPNEGALGSSLELEAVNTTKSQSLTFYSVLHPLKKGDKAPEIAKTENGLRIGDDLLEFHGGECVLHRNGETQKYRLW